MRLDATPALAPVRADAAPQAAFQRALQSLLGQSMQGQVLARLGDGSFLVQVAGTPARMQLPAGALVGAEVELTLIALDPRPTFQVGGRDAGAGASVTYAEAQAAPAQATRTSLAATLLGKALAPPASGFDAAAPAATLSSTGRAISNALARADAAAPLPIAGKAALMNPGAPDPARLAQSLHDAVGASGLFYESHVAEWADGKRSLPDLMREPQMRQTGDARALPGADPAAAQLINQQLHTQEQARVLWQGEVWPGQQMEWEINKDAPDDAQEPADDEPAPAWRSGMRFQFPQLGAVAATLVLRQGGLQIHLLSGSEASGGALRAHAAELENALAAAGVPLAALTIGRIDAE
ncbi:hypothetical protein AAKU55_000842 [Oxalobacteraceae bacterium GrIS 1.11]